MEIRIRETGAVMFWNEFRALLLAQNPGELITVAPQTEEWLDAHGADVVFEGPQATGGTVYQYSQRSGVEQAADKWYTKYILGPVFTDTTAEDGTVTTAVENEVAYKAMKDAEQAKSVRASRDAKLAETDWVVIKAMETGAVVPTDIAAERQALRDITGQVGFPWTITWPETP